MALTTNTSYFDYSKNPLWVSLLLPYSIFCNWGQDDTFTEKVSSGHSWGALLTQSPHNNSETPFLWCPSFHASLCNHTIISLCLLTVLKTLSRNKNHTNSFDSLCSKFCSIRR